MNKINVLYQNVNFKKSGGYINDNLETPIFASDETLADLLKKASLSNFDSYKKDLKKVSSTKVTNSFQKHPRYITDDSFVSLDETAPNPGTEKDKLDSIIHKVTFKRHMKLETSTASLIKTDPSCKIINTNFNITDNCLTNIAELEEETIKEMTKPEIKEDFLGVKLKSYLIKICAWMQEIRSTVQGGITPLEGTEDYYRRQKRAAEFSSRFSRNYVYQLGRQDIEKNSVALINLVQDTLIKREEPETKPIIKPVKKIKKTKEKQVHKKNPLESRLSMYSVAFKKNQKGNPNWKKNAEKLANAKFEVQSRYKNPKQPPTSLVDTLQETKPKSIAPPKRISHTSNSASQMSLEPVKINEDDIVTMVETDSKILAKKQQMDLVPSPNGIRGRLEPLLKSLVAEVSAGKEDDLLGQGVCEDMLLKLRDLLDQVQHPNQNSSEKIDKKDLVSKNRVTVTGPKNAKLICIKDKSCFESKTEVKTLKPNLEDSIQHPKSLSVLPILERNSSRKQLSQKNSHTMANLSKQYTINIIQYKIEFHKYTKPLMMYRKSSQVLPWILTGKITDALFDHLMASIMDEININGLAEKMYKSEFETC